MRYIAIVLLAGPIAGGLSLPPLAVVLLGISLFFAGTLTFALGLLQGLARFGWMGWVIREGKAIATSRELRDGNGIEGGGYHPFFTKEGKLRDGLEFLTEPPRLHPPWEQS